MQYVSSSAGPGSELVATEHSHHRKSVHTESVFSTAQVGICFSRRDGILEVTIKNEAFCKRNGVGSTTIARHESHPVNAVAGHCSEELLFRCGERYLANLVLLPKFFVHVRCGLLAENTVDSGLQQAVNLARILTLHNCIADIPQIRSRLSKTKVMNRGSNGAWRA